MFSFSMIHCGCQAIFVAPTIFTQPLARAASLAAKAAWLHSNRQISTSQGFISASNFAIDSSNCLTPESSDKKKECDFCKNPSGSKLHEKNYGQSMIRYKIRTNPQSNNVGRFSIKKKNIISFSRCWESSPSWIDDWYHMISANDVVTSSKLFKDINYIVPPFDNSTPPKKTPENWLFKTAH